jgi:ABC-type transport system involved in cytochrome c biogenesis permease subunit
MTLRYGSGNAFWISTQNRQTIIALLNYHFQKPFRVMMHWQKDVAAAHLLLGTVEGDGV